MVTHLASHHHKNYVTTTEILILSISFLPDSRTTITIQEFKYLSALANGSRKLKTEFRSKCEDIKQCCDQFWKRKVENNVFVRFIFWRVQTGTLVTCKKILKRLFISSQVWCCCSYKCTVYLNLFGLFKSSTGRLHNGKDTVVSNARSCMFFGVNIVCTSLTWCSTLCSLLFERSLEFVWRTVHV